jgi:hypothetical protein
MEKTDIDPNTAKDALFLLRMLGFFHYQNIMEIIFQLAAEAPEWHIQDY